MMSTAKKIAIYLTNTDRSGWDKPYADYAVMTAELLAPLLPEYDIELFDVVAGELPDDPTVFAGVVLTGSLANVSSHEPWMDALYEHIRILDQAKVKLVGICFGHQAIAHVLGGKVGPHQPQVGIKSIQVTNQQAWMLPWQPSVGLLAGNYQQVQALPDSFEVLGKQTQCEIPLYVKAEHILGCQYHPEFSPDYMHLYVDKVASKLGPERTATARQELQGTHDGALVGQWIANFIVA